MNWNKLNNSNNVENRNTQQIYNKNMKKKLKTQMQKGKISNEMFFSDSKNSEIIETTKNYSIKEHLLRN